MRWQIQKCFIVLFGENESEQDGELSWGKLSFNLPLGRLNRDCLGGRQICWFGFQGKSGVEIQVWESSTYR